MKEYLCALVIWCVFKLPSLCVRKLLKKYAALEKNCKIALLQVLSAYDQTACSYFFFQIYSYNPSLLLGNYLLSEVQNAGEACSTDTASTLDSTPSAKTHSDINSTCLHSELKL